jgi:hypothetical protein
MSRDGAARERRARARAALGAAALGALTAAASARAQGMATADRLLQPGFWPTKPAPRSEYVGTAACARCHPGPAAAQAKTSMARTLSRAADSGVLGATPLTVRLSGYDYEIAARGGERVLRAEKDGRSLEQPLGWAFGAGRIGQTFVYRRGASYHESRVSYLGAVAGLGFTPKRALEAPRDLEEALGRPVGPDEARRCFSCHSAATTAAGVIDEERLIPGVTCETCHGPGARHVAVVEEDRAAEIPHSLLRPSRSDPAAAVDFCGACHGTFWDVTLAGEKGLAALRSQPFRLQSSACWKGEGDSRLVCTACHDPHRPVETDPLAYDPRCLGCHAAAAPSVASAVATTPGPRPCPVADRSCVSCHMPKYEVEEMRHAFTDHRIRVVCEGGSLR